MLKMPMIHLKAVKINLILQAVSPTNCAHRSSTRIWLPVLVPLPPNSRKTKWWAQLSKLRNKKIRRSKYTIGSFASASRNRKRINASKSCSRSTSLWSRCTRKRRADTRPSPRWSSNVSRRRIRIDKGSKKNGRNRNSEWLRNRTRCGRRIRTRTTQSRVSRSRLTRWFTKNKKPTWRKSRRSFRKLGTKAWWPSNNGSRRPTKTRRTSRIVTRCASSRKWTTQTQRITRRSCWSRRRSCSSTDCKRRSRRCSAWRTCWTRRVTRARSSRCSNRRWLPKEGQAQWWHPSLKTRKTASECRLL